MRRVGEPSIASSASVTSLGEHEPGLRTDRPSGVRSDAWRARTARFAAYTPPAGWEWLLLGALLVGGAALALAQTRGTVFADDEWVWILHRRSGGVSTFLTPHNSHLSLVPIVIYRLLFAAVGLRHYWPYRVIVTAAHLTVVTLVFVYVRARVGAWLALLAAALLVFFGPGWQDFLWPFQMAWLIAIGCGVAALVALDRRDRIGDVAACVLLAVSLGSAGPGLAVAAGLVVAVLLDRPRRRLWIVAVPIVLYLLWWAKYQSTNVSHDSIFYLTRFVVDAAAGVLSSLAGLSASNATNNSGDFLSWGVPLLALGIAGLVWRLRRLGRVPDRVWVLGAMALAFWVTTAIGRAYVTLGSAVLTSTGDESRYLYIGAVILLLLAADALVGVRLSRVAGAIAGVLVLFAVASNIGSLRDGGASLRTESAQTVTELGTLDMTRAIVSPTFTSNGFIFGILQAGPYFAAERALGSVAASPAVIAGEPDSDRVLADQQLIAIHRVFLAATGTVATTAPPPFPEGIQAGTVTAQGACLSFTPAAFTPAGAVAALEFRLPPAGAVLQVTGTGPASVGLRRFSAGQFEPLGTLAPGRSALLRIGPDAATQPWHVRIAPAGAARVCTAG